VVVVKPAPAVGRVRAGVGDQFPDGRRVKWRVGGRIVFEVDVQGPCDIRVEVVLGQDLGPARHIPPLQSKHPVKHRDGKDALSAKWSDSYCNKLTEVHMSEDQEVVVCTSLESREVTMKRIVFVRSLCRAELQRFIEEPPGEGFAVIYAFVNIEDGKVYVGKHEHAQNGKSFLESRCQRHLNPTGITTYFAHAMRKHGKKSFEYHIVWHGPLSQVNDQECFWISSNGLHTIKDHGGWGYNLRGGGEGGALAPSVIAKIKESMATDESKTKRSNIAKEQMQREALDGKLSLADRSRDAYSKLTDDQKSAWRIKISDARNQPKSRAEQSIRSTNLWVDVEYRARTTASIKKARTTEKAREQMSHDSKLRWANPDFREKLMESFEKRSSNSEYIELQSKSQKLYWEGNDDARHDASVRKSAFWDDAEKRSKTLDGMKRFFDNPPSGWHEANAEKRRKIGEEKHALSMSGMSEKEKRKYESKLRESKQRANRIRDRLLALRAVTGWERAKQSDLPRAKKLGIV